MKSPAPLRRDPGNAQNGANITLSDLFVYIHQYSMRYLSFETDALDAFRGLPSRSSIYTYWGLPVHAPYLNETYRSSGITGTREDYFYQGRNLSGLFLTSLYFEFNEGSDVLRWTGEGVRAREGFPSWSWLGWLEPVRFKPINSWTDVHEADATLLGAEDADGAVVPLPYLLSQAKTGNNSSTVVPDLTSYLWIEADVLSLRFQCERGYGFNQKVDFCLDHPCFARNLGNPKWSSFDYLNPLCNSKQGIRDGCKGTMTRTQLAAKG